VTVVVGVLVGEGEGVSGIEDSVGRGMVAGIVGLKARVMEGVATTISLVGKLAGV
jgi:hypothetical protein